MKEKMDAYKGYMGEVWDLAMTASLLGWDQQTNMPHNGVVERSEQLATLSKLIHERTVAEEHGKMLDDLLEYAKTLDPDSDDARLIRRAKITLIKRAAFYRTGGPKMPG